MKIRLTWAAYRKWQKPLGIYTTTWRGPLPHHPRAVTFALWFVGIDVWYGPQEC